ncbi:MAG TPA: translocation/assembly module TamB domain-containing protein [Albitalea sp.]|nr:translocation/assembly module TamB domain-containing protein [Albitalea sp.]
MDEHASPTPPALPPRYRWRRRMAWLIGGVVALAVALLLAAGSGVWWTLRSEAGAAWLLSRLPGLQISGGKGRLWGDFEAERLEFALPGGGKVVMTGVGWRGLSLHHAPWTTYRTRVAMSELHASRVEIVLPAGPAKPSAGPPANLKLPVELEVGALHIGELHTAALGERPVRDLRAQVHLGAQFGMVHRIDLLSMAWDRLKAEGSVRIAAAAPLALDAQVALAQVAPEDGGAWRAHAQLEGPLAQPALRATVRARARGSRPEQSLDLRATLRPFEAWPLGELQASTHALDLSALHSAAPVTSISGQASAQTSGLHQPARLQASLANADAGRWNEGRLPLRNLTLDLQARPDDPRKLDLRQLVAELGDAQRGAGQLQAEGRWTPAQWSVDARITSLRPSLLDARAPAMTLSGPLQASGKGFDGPIDQATLELKADLAGEFAARGPARQASLALDARGTLHRIEVRRALAQAGGARASFAGVASHAASGGPWRLAGQATLTDFDPAPWWPGREDALLRKGPNRLNAKADLNLALPLSGTSASAWDRVAALRGHADATIERSVLAGVPLQGELMLRSADGGTTAVSAQLEAAGNRVQAGGHLGRSGSGDQWELTIAAPSLDRLAPLWRMGPAPQGESAFAGSLSGSARIDGRWPRLVTRGRLEAAALRIGQTSVQGAQARWQLDTTGDAAVDLQASLTQLSFSQALFKGTPPISSAQLQLQGTMRAHTLELHADTRALPPAWADTLRSPPAAPTGSPAPSVSSAAASTAAARTVAVLVARGGATQSSGSRGAAPRWTGWRGSLQQLELRSTDPHLAPWLRTRDLGIEAQWAGGPVRVALQPGRAELLGAALRWQRIVWQAAWGRQPAQIEAQAELEPLAVAPLLARAQPTFGWGGDLAVVGHVNIRSAPAFTADVVLERQRGDLTVTDETGKTQALALTDLRLGLDVQDGVWNFTQGLAGKTLGVAAGAFVARTSPQATWPSPDTPVQGVLEVQVADLGTWGPWLPAGWRLNGALRTSAGIGGRFGAPEYTGAVHGSGLGVRNFLLGVNVSDGAVDVALQGATARIERFTARAGSGSVKLEGSATLGEAPQAQLALQADKFQLLGRVDRRIVTSGQAQLHLDRKTLALDGQFRIDEGLIDFSRSDAPHLSDDVQVVRADGTNGAQAAASPNPAPGHDVKLDLKVALGERLRLRGRGLDAGLRGDLHITSPGNQLAIAGTVRAVDGTYAAYGQKLTIDRGLITFNGPVENPRLDIEATRPNIDTRVGVLVTGTALNPRVRLFSEPEMAEIDKLSWLVLGRASEGLGRTDTALLQRAALALLAGEGEGMGDQFTKAIGLDEVSLRQTEGEVRETVISLGKQVSRRWYVGYERSLNATAGTWQLIYRIAQRFTLRAQTGADSSLDVIWTWRWQ